MSILYLVIFLASPQPIMMAPLMISPTCWDKLSKMQLQNFILWAASFYLFLSLFLHLLPAYFLLWRHFYCVAPMVIVCVCIVFWSFESLKNLQKTNGYVCFSEFRFNFAHARVVWNIMQGKADKSSLTFAKSLPKIIQSQQLLWLLDWYNFFDYLSQR